VCIRCHGLYSQALALNEVDQDLARDERFTRNIPDAVLWVLTLTSSTDDSIGEVTEATGRCDCSAHFAIKPRLHF
jgi:hypothetical protein